jgi:hypothetical protein
VTQRLGAYFCCLFAVALGCVALAPAAEAGWLPPVAISESAEHAGAPHVVLDSQGNATAVWDRWNGEDTVVESAYRPAGEPWEAPVDLSESELPGEADPGAEDAQSPQIAVDGAGDVTVVWERWAGTKLLVQSVERPAGGEWTTPVDLGETSLGPDPEPWVAVDSDGDAIAVWKDGEVIQSAYRPADLAWETAVAVSAGESFVPQAAMNAEGDATIVWMHFDGTRYVVESAYRPAGGEWESPNLVSRSGEEGGDPQIAIDGAGDTLVAWRGEDKGVEYVRTAYRPAGGSWEAPTDASSPGEQVQSIQDAVDPDGNAIVAWAGDGVLLGEYEDVHTSFRPSGGVWGAPTDLSTGSGNGYPSDLVFDQSGNAAIIWEREAPDAGSWIIEAAYRPFEGAWEKSVELSEEGTQGTDPSVVLDAPGDTTDDDGDATAAWVSGVPHTCEGPKGIEEPCYSYTVQAAGYDPDGLPAVELEAPSVAEVGQPVSISMSAVALFSPSIQFGDGGGAAEAEASHVYEAPGEYEVSGAGAEVLGYTATTRRSITIVPVGEGTRSTGTPSIGSGEASGAGVVSGDPESGPSAPTGIADGPPATPATRRSGAACVAARANLRVDRHKLAHAFGARKHRQLAQLKKALRRVGAAC